MGLSQNFLTQVGSAQPPLGLDYFPLKFQSFQFFYLWVISSGWVKKYPGQRWLLAPYLLQLESVLGKGQDQSRGSKSYSKIISKVSGLPVQLKIFSWNQVTCFMTELVLKTLSKVQSTKVLNVFSNILSSVETFKNRCWSQRICVDEKTNGLNPLHL